MRAMDSVPSIGAGHTAQSSLASTGGAPMSTGARRRGRPRKTEAEKAETKARYAEARRRMRRENALLRAQIAEAKRYRASVDPAFKAVEDEAMRRKFEEDADRRARAAAAKRQKRQANAELRAREAAIKRLRREMDPELRAREAEAQRQRRQQHPDLREREAEIKRQRREDPEFRAREAETRRQLRQQDPELREREAEIKRRRRQDPELRAREAEARRQYRRQHAVLREREAEIKRQRREDPEFRAREAEARRQQQQDYPEVRARKAGAKRLRRRADVEQRALISQHVALLNELHEALRQKEQYKEKCGHAESQLAACKQRLRQMQQQDLQDRHDEVERLYQQAKARFEGDPTDMATSTSSRPLSPPDEGASFVTPERTSPTHCMSSLEAARERLREQQATAPSSQSRTQHPGSPIVLEQSPPGASASTSSWMEHMRRLIEERDTLLSSGIYSKEDAIIVELNRRIADTVRKHV